MLRSGRWSLGPTPIRFLTRRHPTKLNGTRTRSRRADASRLRSRRPVPSPTTARFIQAWSGPWSFADLVSGQIANEKHIVLSSIETDRPLAAPAEAKTPNQIVARARWSRVAREPRCPISTSGGSCAKKAQTAATASSTADNVRRPTASVVTMGNSSWPYAPCSRGCIGMKPRTPHELERDSSAISALSAVSSYTIFVSTVICIVRRQAFGSQAGARQSHAAFHRGTSTAGHRGAAAPAPVTRGNQARLTSYLAATPSASIRASHARLTRFADPVSTALWQGAWAGDVSLRTHVLLPSTAL